MGAIDFLPQNMVSSNCYQELFTYVNRYVLYMYRTCTVAYFVIIVKRL